MSIAFDPATSNGSVVFSNGNLTATWSAHTGVNELVRANISETSGKWYWEYTIGSTGAVGSNFLVGIANSSLSVSQALGNTADGYGYDKSGGKVFSGSFTGYGASYTAGDVISVLFDADNDTLTFWKNGTTQGTAFTGVTGSWIPAISAGDNSGTPAVTANFGGTAFAFTPTAGFIGFEAPPSAGNGAVTLQQLTAEGRRVAAGTAVMQAMTAVGGYNGRGAVVLESLQVSSSGGTNSGLAILLPPIALGTGHQSSFSLSAMEPLDALGTGTSSSIIGLDAEFPLALLEASGFTGGVAILDETFPALILTSDQSGAELDFLVLTLDAELLVGSTSDFSGVLPMFTDSATAILNLLSDGDSTLPIITLEAIGLGQNQGAFLGNVPRIYTTAIGFSGGVATLAEDVPILSLSGIGYGPYIGIADLFPSSIHLDAEGFSAVASALRTWVLNMRKKGLTEYSNFAFNSYAEYRGTVLAAGATGIVKLSGANTDAGTSIDAQVRTGAESFDTSYNKRVPRIYVGYSTDGAMHFSTITSQDGKRTYLLPHNGITKIQQRRVPVGRGPKSPYWQYECTNVAGSDFLLEHVQVYPEKSSRRVV